MKLEKELNKPKYNLTSHEVEQIISLFSTAIEDIIGEDDEYSEIISGRWESRRDDLRKSQRQRKKRWLNEQKTKSRN